MLPLGLANAGDYAPRRYPLGGKLFFFHVAGDDQAINSEAHSVCSVGTAFMRIAVGH